MLGEAGLLSAPTVAADRRMAGFRNVLVHGYAEVDDDLVVETVLEGLADVDRLRSELAAPRGEPFCQTRSIGRHPPKHQEDAMDMIVQRLEADLAATAEALVAPRADE